MASILNDILAAVETAIEGASLSGVASGDVDVVKLPYHAPESTLSTGCWISPGAIQATNATNVRDDIVYTVWVTPWQKSNKDVTTNQDRLQLWRQQILRLFHNKRLSSVASSVICKVEPGEVFPYGAFHAGYDSAPIAIKVTSREART